MDFKYGQNVSRNKLYKIALFTSETTSLSCLYFLVLPHIQIFPDLCVLQNVFKIILLFTRIYMILRVLFVKAEDTETSLTCAIKYVVSNGRGVWISRTGGIGSYPPSGVCDSCEERYGIIHTTLVINQSYCRIYASCGITTDILLSYILFFNTKIKTPFVYIVSTHLHTQVRNSIIVYTEKMKGMTINDQPYHQS